MNSNKPAKTHLVVSAKGLVVFPVSKASTTNSGKEASREVDLVTFSKNLKNSLVELKVVGISAALQDLFQIINQTMEEDTCQLVVDIAQVLIAVA